MSLMLAYGLARNGRKWAGQPSRGHRPALPLGTRDTHPPQDLSLFLDQSCLVGRVCLVPEKPRPRQVPSEEQGCLAPGGQAPAAARVRTSCGSDAPLPGDLPAPLLSCEGQEGRVAERLGPGAPRLHVRPGPATPQPCDSGQALTPPASPQSGGQGEDCREGEMGS